MAYTTIDDPSAYFQTATYTGTSADGNVITNDGNSDLQPDLLWIKRRNAAYAHGVFDSSRGITKYLRTNTSDAEDTYALYLNSLDTNGFELDIGDQSTNNSAGTYVAWQWKANAGSTSSNTSGTITSTVQANTDAGFSIVTYTGNGDPYGNTFGHGLGAAPKMVIVKRRSGTAQSWAVYHEAIGAGNYLRLNGTNASAVSSAHWYNTAPTSTLVYVGGNGEVNGSSETYVAYCFAEKQGYSKFGKYTGNGNTNGPFVYTGFKPAFVIIKSSSATGSWLLWDNKRDVDNPVVEYLLANTASDESTDTGAGLDFCSNGFKVRSTGGSIGTSGVTYIYMAFAENPFVTSTGIPTTAR